MHRRLMIAVFVMSAPAFGSGGMDYSVCRWTAEKVDSVIESSVTLPSPSIPTPARGSTPTNPELESQVLTGRCCAGCRIQLGGKTLASGGVGRTVLVWEVSDPGLPVQAQLEAWPPLALTPALRGRRSG
jgi:hypothetical protein